MVVVGWFRWGLAVFVLAGWLGVGVGVCCGCWRLARGVAWLLGCWLVWSLVGGWLFVVAGWSSACWSRSVGDCITRMQAATAPVLSLACEVLDSANSATLLGFVTYAPIASWWFFVRACVLVVLFVVVVLLVVVFRCLSFVVLLWLCLCLSGPYVSMRRTRRIAVTKHVIAIFCMLTCEV